VEVESHSAARAIPEIAQRLRAGLLEVRNYRLFDDPGSRRNALAAAAADLLTLADEIGRMRDSGELPPVQIRWKPKGSWDEFLSTSWETNSHWSDEKAPVFPEGAVIQVRLATVVREPARLIRPLQESVVEEYRQALDEGQELPPVEISYDGATIRLPNGQHRTEARHRRGEEWIDAKYHPGGMHEALLIAAKADRAVGLSRTRADKRRAVELLLGDPEYREWSDRKLASATGTSHTFVANLKVERGLRQAAPAEDEGGNVATDESAHGGGVGGVHMEAEAEEEGEADSLDQDEDGADEQDRDGDRVEGDDEEDELSDDEEEEENAEDEPSDDEQDEENAEDEPHEDDEVVAPERLDKSAEVVRLLNRVSRSLSALRGLLPGVPEKFLRHIVHEVAASQITAADASARLMQVVPPTIPEARPERAPNAAWGDLPPATDDDDPFEGADEFIRSVG
jgi:hypothetical protein